MVHLSAAWLALGGTLYTLRLSPGGFPKPLTPEEEAHYLTLSAQGDQEARNVLIERNLRLVAHIMNLGYSTGKFFLGGRRRICVRTLRKNGNHTLESGVVP